MTDPSALDQHLAAEMARLSQMGFTQEQFHALCNVLALAKDHPAIDLESARVILERLERQFARVRDGILEETRKTP